MEWDILDGVPPLSIIGFLISNKLSYSEKNNFKLNIIVSTDSVNVID